MVYRYEQRRKRRSDSSRRYEADEADNWFAGLRRSGPDPFSAPPPPRSTSPASTNGPRGGRPGRSRPEDSPSGVFGRLPREDSPSGIVPGAARTSRRARRSGPGPPPVHPRGRPEGPADAGRRRARGEDPPSGSFRTPRHESPSGILRAPREDSPSGVFRAPPESPSGAFRPPREESPCGGPVPDPREAPREAPRFRTRTRPVQLPAVARRRRWRVPAGPRRARRSAGRAGRLAESGFTRPTPAATGTRRDRATTSVDTSSPRRPSPGPGRRRSVQADPDRRPSESYDHGPALVPIIKPLGDCAPPAGRDRAAATRADHPDDAPREQPDQRRCDRPPGPPRGGGARPDVDGRPPAVRRARPARRAPGPPRPPRHRERPDHGGQPDRSAPGPNGGPTRRRHGGASTAVHHPQRSSRAPPAAGPAVPRTPPRSGVTTPARPGAGAGLRTRRPGHRRRPATLRPGTGRRSCHGLRLRTCHRHRSRTCHGLRVRRRPGHRPARRLLHRAHLTTPPALAGMTPPASGGTTPPACGGTTPAPGGGGAAASTRPRRARDDTGTARRRRDGFEPVAFEPGGFDRTATGLDRTGPGYEPPSAAFEASGTATRRRPVADEAPHQRRPLDDGPPFDEAPAPGGAAAGSWHRGVHRHRHPTRAAGATGQAAGGPPRQPPTRRTPVRCRGPGPRRAPAAPLDRRAERHRRHRPARRVRPGLLVHFQGREERA